MSLVRGISMVLLSDHYPLPVLMSLTVYKRFKFYQRDNSPLVATIYRDGVIYMLCIACKSRISMNSCRHSALLLQWSRWQIAFSSSCFL
jgi:uncharacterized protein (DUF2249 family)